MSDTASLHMPHHQHQRDDSALHLGPRKKAYVKQIFLFVSQAPSLYLTLSCLSDPLVSHGRHFGRTVHALCSVQALLTNGLLRMGELADEPEEAFTLESVYELQLIVHFSLFGSFFAGNDASNGYSKLFCKWFRDLRSVSWKARRRISLQSPKR
jgi:hypothetical protein